MEPIYLLRRKFSAPMILLTILIPFLFGMGGIGGSPSAEKIPVPAKKFSVVFIDQSNIETEARDVSIEGFTYLEGRKGEGTFTIAFENIASVNFLLRENVIYAHAKLKDGNTVILAVNKKHKAYGRTKYGTFSISLLDVKKVTFISSGKAQNR